MSSSVGAKVDVRDLATDVRPAATPGPRMMSGTRTDSS
jgi:hypothetical protein